jgi:hypothetical protein
MVEELYPSGQTEEVQRALTSWNSGSSVKTRKCAI